MFLNFCTKGVNDPAIPLSWGIDDEVKWRAETLSTACADSPCLMTIFLLVIGVVEAFDTNILDWAQLAQMK